MEAARIKISILTDAIESLAKLSSLPVGWDYGADGPANPLACAAARKAIGHLLSITACPLEIIPGVDGGVGIIANRADESVELQALPSGKFELLFENASGVVRQSFGLNFEELVTALEEQGWQSPRLFVSCTRHATLNRSYASFSFRDSSGGGISVIGTDCVSASGRSICAHIEEFYDHKIAGQPPVFWRISGTLLPDCVRLEAERTASGDDCHYNLVGLSKGQCLDLLNSVDPTEYEICDPSGHRKITLEELEAASDL